MRVRRRKLTDHYCAACTGKMLKRVFILFPRRIRYFEVLIEERTIGRILPEIVLHILYHCRRIIRYPRIAARDKCERQEQRYMFNISYHGLIRSPKRNVSEGEK